MSKYPVPIDDLPDVLLPPVSRGVAKQLQRAQESNSLEVGKYGLAAGSRSLMDQYDTEAAHDAADTAMKSSLRLLKDGLAEIGESAAAAEILGGWVADLNHGHHKRFRRRFGG